MRLANVRTFLLMSLCAAPWGLRLGAEGAASEAAGILTPAMLGQAPAAQPAPQPAAAPAPSEKPVMPEATPPWQPSDLFKSLTWKGYVQTSYTFNGQKPRPAAGNENVGRVFDTNSNEFMLNAVEVVIEKPVDKDHPVGFVIDPLLGQTAPVIHSGGFFTTENLDLDLVQAYIQFYCPWSKTKVIAGKFITTNGTEVIYAPGNDQFSRSFLFGFAIPFTHTGLLATQPLLKRADGETDMLTASAGVSNGWDVVKDQNESKLILTSASFTPCDQFSFTPNFYYSFSEQAASEKNGRTLIDLVASVSPFKGLDAGELESLKFGGNFDWGGEEGADPSNGRYAQWWGFAGYARYDFALIGDKRTWYIAGRGEYFDDSDGSRTAAFTSATSPGARFWEMTFTLAWQPLNSFLLRSEVRYDKADQNVFFQGQGNNAPGGTADQSAQTTVSFDAMFLF